MQKSVMLIKTIKLFIVSLVFVLFSCVTAVSGTGTGDEKTPKKAEVADLSFKVFIEQDGVNIKGLNGLYTIEDQKFNILISNAENKNIHIFAYHNEEMFSKYSYPVERKNTVIFHPATALIDSADENKEITLVVNSEMQYNAITPEKRLDNANAVIKIKDIADAGGNFNGTLFLTIFVDLNDNNTIEANEVKNISIKINSTAKSILFSEKIYVSTLGSRIKEIKNLGYTNEYFYVKITNDMEKQLFLLLFGRNNFLNTYSSTNRIFSVDYSKYNMYVIFSPITTEIELHGNPYHYKGEKKLIFDVKINKEANSGTYVFCREYRVEKNKDIFEIWINDNGKLKKLSKYDL